MKLPPKKRCFEPLITSIEKKRKRKVKNEKTDGKDIDEKKNSSSEMLFNAKFPNKSASTDYVSSVSTDSSMEGCDSCSLTYTQTNEYAANLDLVCELDSFNLVMLTGEEEG